MSFLLKKSRKISHFCLKKAENRNFYCYAMQGFSVLCIKKEELSRRDSVFFAKTKIK